MLLKADVQDFIETYYGLSLERLNVAGMLNDFIAMLVGTTACDARRT